VGPRRASTSGKRSKAQEGHMRFPEGRS
jgi:hypothetical protein